MLDVVLGGAWRDGQLLAHLAVAEATDDAGGLDRHLGLLSSRRLTMQVESNA
jgi:hypothetical protein